MCRLEHEAWSNTFLCSCNLSSGEIGRSRWTSTSFTLLKNKDNWLFCVTEVHWHRNKCTMQRMKIWNPCCLSGFGGINQLPYQLVYQWQRQKPTILQHTQRLRTFCLSKEILTISKEKKGLCMHKVCGNSSVFRTSP
jgi:hypothetical protein